MFKKIAQYKKEIAGASTLAAVQAHAALPAGASTAMTDAATDAAALGLLAFLIVVAIAGWKYLKRGV